MACAPTGSLTACVCMCIQWRELMACAPTGSLIACVCVCIQRRELMACAPTGSGKTLAFVLPLLHHLQTPRSAGVRAVVLSPTRELAEQVCVHFTALKGVKKDKGEYISMDWKPIAELRSITCHMGSHTVTCHPTQVNAPRLNPSHAGRYLIYLPRRDGRLS